MAKIPLGRVGELVRMAFEVLKENPSGVPAGVVLDALERATKLTDYEAGTFPKTGVRRFETIVRFATIAPARIGWLVKRRGSWTLTAEGLNALDRYPDPEEFIRAANQLYAKWRKARGDDSSDAHLPEDDETSEETAAVTFEQALEQSWNEIESYLSNYDPFEFQQLVADLLQAMGYYVSWVAPRGKDGGTDIVALTDPLGTRGPRIKAQVKRVGQKVDINGLKSFMANLGEHDLGMYVSMGGFTRDAEEFARANNKWQIVLVDLERLVDLWIEHYAKLSDLARTRLPLTPIYFLTPKS